MLFPRNFKTNSLFNKTNKIQKLNAVQPYELMRIYAKYPIDKQNKKGFMIFKKVSTNNKIKFIIQINQDKGLIMKSYQIQFTKFWKNKNNKETIQRLNI